MNDNQFDDLKQLVETTVGQSEVRLTERLDKIDHRLEKLHKEMKEGFAGVADTTETVTEHQDTQINDHEVRITNLEQAA